MIAGWLGLELRNDPLEVGQRDLALLIIKVISQSSHLLALVSGIGLFIVWARGGNGLTRLSSDWEPTE